jgi:hypothetical protein
LTAVAVVIAAVRAVTAVANPLYLAIGQLTMYTCAHSYAACCAFWGFRVLLLSHRTTLSTLGFLSLVVLWTGYIGGSGRITVELKPHAEQLQAAASS